MGVPLVGMFQVDSQIVADNRLQLEGSVNSGQVSVPYGNCNRR